MSLQTNNQCLRYPGIASGAAIVVISLLVLIGWVEDIDRLKRFIPGLVSMNPITAVAFLLCGVSLLLQSDQSDPSNNVHSGISRGALFIALIVFLTGLLRLWGYLFDQYDIGIDQILFSEKLSGESGHLPNRMAPNTALGFIFVGFALAALDIKTKQDWFPAELAAFTVLIIPLAGVIGYSYGVKSLYGITESPMALNSTICLLITATGILCIRPDRGLMAVIFSPGPSRTLAGYLFPTLLIAMLGLGWLRLELERLGFLDGESGMLFIVLTSIFLFGLIIFYVARELQRLENERRRLERQRNTFFLQPLGLFAVLNFAGHFMQLNSLFTRTLGYNRLEMISRAFIFIVHPRDEHATSEAINRARNGEQIIGFENRVKCKDGSWRTFSWHMVAVKEDRSIYVTAEDITELKATDTTLRDTERDLELTLNSIGEAVLTIDLYFNVTRLNPVAQSLTGWSESDAKGQNIENVFAIIDEKNRDKNYAPIEDALVSGKSHQRSDTTILTAKDGKKFHIADSCSPIRNHDNEIVGAVVVFRDISREKIAKNNLHKANRLALQEREKLRSILYTIEDGVISIDEFGKIESFNPAAETLFGYKENEVLGKNVSLLMPEPYQSQHDSYLENYRKTGESRFIGVGRELVGQKKNGSTFPMELSIGQLEVQGARTFTGVIRDITERKKHLTELTKAIEQAESANEAKSDFLASMSHEIRTPINGIMGMVDVLHQTSLKGFQVEMVEIIQESAASLLDIINDILDFAKIESGQLELAQEPFNLEALHESVSIMLNRLAEKSGVELVVFTDPKLPKQVLGDDIRLRQVLVNLIGNGIKFSSKLDRPGRVATRLENISGGADYVDIKISVKDNGIGMNQKEMDHVFESFVQASTKTSRRFGGTGLGLSISQHIINLMGSEIRVESTPNEGATFSAVIRLPVASTSAKNLQIEKGCNVEGLSCLVVGESAGLAPDLIEYLTSAGAFTEWRPDMGSAGDWLRMNKSSGLWILVVDAGFEHPLEQTLRKQLGNLRDLQVNVLMVVIERGSRHSPRKWGENSVMMDGNALSRKAFLRAVAIAGSRATFDNTFTNRTGDSDRNVIAGISREDAMASGRFILVAEDNETNQKVILKQLALFGAAADIAKSGKEALELWRSGIYHLLLTDLHMPDMDGFELTKAIRAEEMGEKRTPIIALTANALSGEREKCLAAGMDDFLTKPARLEEINSVLSQWLPAGNNGNEKPLETQTNVIDDPQNIVIPDMIKSLFEDDPEGLQEFLNLFLNSAKEALPKVNEAFRTGDLQKMASECHKLKSAARSIGATDLSNICEKIELTVNGEREDSMDYLMENFKLEISHTLSSLDSRGM